MEIHLTMVERYLWLVAILLAGPAGLSLGWIKWGKGDDDHGTWRRVAGVAELAGLALVLVLQMLLRTSLVKAAAGEGRTLPTDSWAFCGIFLVAVVFNIGVYAYYRARRQ